MKRLASPDKKNTKKHKFADKKVHNTASSCEVGEKGKYKIKMILLLNMKKY